MHPTPGIESIGQVHVSVEDLPRAVAFFRDVLGLELLFEVPGQPMAFFSCGEVRLYLGEPERPEYRSRPLLYYRVPSIRDAYESLVRHGVELEGEPHVVHRTEASELWMVGFRDSEGNPACLMSEVVLRDAAEG